MANVKLQVQRSVSGEYRVAYYEDGKFKEGPTYYASDLKDAVDSRQAMAKEAEGLGHQLNLPNRPRTGMDF